MNLDNLKDVLTVEDLYEILPLGKNKIYELLRSNKLQSIKVCRKYLVLKQYLFNFLTESSCNAVNTYVTEACNQNVVEERKGEQQ